MTLKEYFEKEQPISNATIEETCLYKDIATIEFKVDENKYGTIKIAHVDEDTWSLGYELKCNTKSPVICKDCTSHAITKGHINNLVYGMAKVLLLHLRQVQHSKTLEETIENGLDEAADYCDNNLSPVGKITI